MHNKNAKQAYVPSYPCYDNSGTEHNFVSQLLTVPVKNLDTTIIGLPALET
jgi:hypothetical protein